MSQSRLAATDDGRAGTRSAGYYGLPVIHGPHWKWLIIGYFYCGGISGGAAAIGAMARLRGSSEMAALCRISTYVSFAALLPCPAFLILDLGRPARFLNMLRAFRPSSPMSMGTWGLSVFGAISTLSVAHQLWSDLQGTDHQHLGRGESRWSMILALGGLTSGLFVAGYTGVLLAATAVPLWCKRPALIAPLFLASAISSGTAAIVAVATALDAAPRDAVERMHRFEAVATLAEGTLLVAWITALGRTGKPLNDHLLGYVVRDLVAGAGITAPLAIAATRHVLPRRARRGAALLASALTLVGVLALRFAVVEAGRMSANDPAATFDMTG